ncbi:MAG: transcriptional repressor [Candidatus Electryoneaceae bacterium]|nr:transcriptional repressor [Candidatus Electryoneaceae bacterium]
MTKQRKVILEELHKVTNHPTADMIYRSVRKRLPRISLGTIYRNLDLLAEQGIIQKLGSEGSKMRFDGDITEHYHIRCVDCGIVDDLFVQAEVSVRKPTSNTEYEILDQRLEFLGRCPKCREKHNQLVKNQR